MKKNSPIINRKLDHLQISINNDVESRDLTGKNEYSFIHNALPELNLKDITTETKIFNKKINLPLIISSMTGGVKEAQVINERLAEAAQVMNVAMAVGSQRALFEHPDILSTYDIRRKAPDILLFANLGAVQLNYGYTSDHCIKAVELIKADGLILHLNPFQELLQPEGDTNFAGLLKKIERVCKELSVPVVVKEVGWGISGVTAKKLIDAGVAAIDVAGFGGTSWAKIELNRNHNEVTRKIMEPFLNWGIPTMCSIEMVKSQNPTFPVFASGGIRDGLDMAKCIALGASVCGIARPLLIAANESTQKTISLIEILQAQLRTCMFLIGAEKINNITKDKLG